MNILITGANGFVGLPLCRKLLTVSAIKNIFGSVRSVSSAQKLPKGVTPIKIKNLNEISENSNLLSNIDGIIHLAARVHQLSESNENHYKTINTDATLSLAQAAANAGIKKFIYLSSIKVNGEGSPERPSHYNYSETTDPHPTDPYGVSKWLAEQGLAKIHNNSPLNVTILRPPLVYGPEVKANFLKLLKLVDQGLPLPLGKIDNLRSLVFVENLVDAIQACLIHPEASGETFLVSDGEDLSTSDLVRFLAQSMKRQAFLLPVPSKALLWGFTKFKRREMAERLVGSLTIDSRKIRARLDWAPPYTTMDGLQATCDWYLKCVKNT